MSSKVQKIMVQPIVRFKLYFTILSFPLFIFQTKKKKLISFLFLYQNLIFRYLQNVSFFQMIFEKIMKFSYLSYLLNFINLQKERVQIWLVDKTDMRIEGQIIVRFFSFFSLKSKCFIYVYRERKGKKKQREKERVYIRERFY